jgi:type III secretion protein W
MSEPSKIATSRIVGIDSDVAKSQKAAEAGALSKYAISQEGSEEEFTEWTELSAFNPLAMARRFEPLEVKAKKKGREDEDEKVKAKDKQILEIQKVQESSEQYQQRNPELQQRTLLLLRSRISKNDTPEEILDKVLEFYPDVALADEALEFLLENSGAELAALVQRAKDELEKRFAREIRAGRNIGARSREFAEQGLGSPTALRDMYREVTGNPRDAATLFDELSAKFAFEKMKTVIEFLLHSLGADLKAKGPSIPRAELYRLVTETRTLQAILGIYRFFNSRMRMVAGAFNRQGIILPIRLTFEVIAKQFVKLLQERYPNAEKAYLTANQMGIGKDLAAQMIIFLQMRDAVRGVSPKLFRSEQHRQDVLNTFMTALEELEEELEEQEEKEEKEKEEE